MKNCETGRSMIEMLGVLAIVGVLSVGGLSGYSKMLSQHKINTSLEQIGLISSKISAYGAGADSYHGLTVASAKKLGAPIEDSNPYSGGINVKASQIESATSNDEQAFVVVYSGLTEEACVALGSGAWGNVMNSSFVGLGVGVSTKEQTIEKALYIGCPGVAGQNDYAVACSGGTTPPPLDPGTATLACTCPSSNCVFMMKFF